MILRMVWAYSTAATDEAVYIIGGNQFSSLSKRIVEYKNDQWRILGDLIQGRQYHGSISVGMRTMVVGGSTANSE